MIDLRSSQQHSIVYDTALIICASILFVVIVFTFGGESWKQIFFVVAVIALMLLAYSVFIEPHHLHVTRYQVPLVSKPEIWIRIVFLSDFHAGGFRNAVWFERIAHEVQVLNPDSVVLGGDFVADRADFMSQLAYLRQLSAPLGKFFVFGNHDYLDRPQDIRSALVSWGFTDMTNRSTCIEHEGHLFEIQGIDDHWRGDPHSFQRLSSNIPHLLLSHEPDVVMDLHEGDTDFILSGHTHGGQVRLPFFGSMYPIPARLGRAVDWGEKIVNGMRLIVSSGLGEQDARIRFFCPPEIVVADIGI